MIYGSDMCQCDMIMEEVAEVEEEEAGSVRMSLVAPSVLSYNFL